MRNAGVVAFVIFALAGPALGQDAVRDFPNRPVAVVVPASPAGITDIAARIIGERLSKLWGKQVVVENKPGGGGSVGATTVARAAPDGYTLFMTTNAELALNAALYAKLSYDPLKDFMPVAMVTKGPILVVANTSAPFNTFADLIAAAKAKPGEITYATPGIGSWNQMTGEWLSDELGFKLLHIPYRGGGPAGVAVAAGEVQVGMLAISSALPHLQSGRAKVLALTSDKRSSIDPSWPTVSEGFIPHFDSMQWVGLFAPAGIDPALRQKIEADVLTVVNSPEIVERFFKVGVEVIGLPGAEATKQLQLDYDIAVRVTRKANIKVD